MGANLNVMFQSIWSYLPQLMGALLVLLVGWLVALALAASVQGILRRTNLGARIGGWMTGRAGAERVNVDAGVARIVYYLILVLVLVAFFQALGLTLATQPLNNLLQNIFEFVPRLLGALLLALIAWVVASGLRFVVTRGLRAAKLDERVALEAAREEGGGAVPLSKSLGDIMYWLVFLLFLPALLDALALKGLLAPVQTMMTRILGYLPNLFAAALILALGWFGARIVQRIVVNLLSAVGADRISESAGLGRVIGRLSEALGIVVYVMVLIPVSIAALNALALDAITQPASNMLNLILEAIPAIFAAVLLLLIAYGIGRVVADLIANLLSGVGFDSILVHLGFSAPTAESKQKPSRIVAHLSLVIIVLLATIEACNLLGFTALGALVARLTVLAGHVILGAAILGLGLYLGNLAAEAIRASRASQAKLLAGTARIAIVFLSGAVALQQIGLAEQIISLTFGLLLGAVALATAMAFGIGGRDAASRKLDEWMKKIEADRE